MFQELEGCGSPPDAYWRQTTWKRIVVIAAGPGRERRSRRSSSSCGVFMPVSTSNGTDVVEACSRQAGRDRHSGPATGSSRSPESRVSRPRSGEDITRAAGGRSRSGSTADGRPLTIGPLRARNDQGVYRIGIQIEAKTGLGASPITAGRKSAQLTWALTSGTCTGLGRLFVGQGTHQITSSVGIVRDHRSRLPAVAPGLLLLPGLHQPRPRAAQPPPGPASRRRAHRDVDPRARPRPRLLAARLHPLQRGRARPLHVLLYLGLRNDLFSGGG